MKPVLYGIFCLITIIGCATQGNQTTSESTAKGTVKELLAVQADIINVHYAPAEFSVVSPGTMNPMAFGLIGALLSAKDTPESTGKLIRTRYAIDDPVMKVRNRFLSILSDTVGLNKIRTHSDEVAFRDKKELRKLIPSGFLLISKQLNGD